MACTLPHICRPRVLIRCSAPERDGQQQQQPHQRSSAARVNGAAAAHRGVLRVGTALETASTGGGSLAAEVGAPVLGAEGDGEEGQSSRQNIPREKQSADAFRQARIVDGGVRYQQTLVIRSYEVGPDKTATIETLLNLLQETALNHVWMSGLLGDGFGATHGMIKNNLIWVVSRMHVQVDQYPIWGEVLDIDTWVGSSGKNSMRRDWLIRGRSSGTAYVRATSTWVMMNKGTRRLSKMPEEVRGEISPWFINRHAIEVEATEKIIKLDSNAKYVESGLKPKRSDLDMNHHVNNVKYVRWMLETLPDQFLHHHQLSSIILEYRKECGRSDVVQSICQPDEEIVSLRENVSMMMGHLPEITNAKHTLAGELQQWPTKYTHLLQLKAGDKFEEIVRGRTTWKKKLYRGFLPVSIVDENICGLI